MTLHSLVGPSTAVSVVALGLAAVLVVTTSVLRELRTSRGATSSRPGGLGLVLAVAAAVAVVATLVRLLAAVS